MWFEAIFELKINLEKGELISIGSVLIGEKLVDILEYKMDYYLSRILVYLRV